jgi:hypothetical protein
MAVRRVLGATPLRLAAAALTIATGALFYRMRIHDQRI